MTTTMSWHHVSLPVSGLNPGSADGDPQCAEISRETIWQQQWFQIRLCDSEALTLHKDEARTVTPRFGFSSL